MLRAGQTGKVSFSFSDRPPPSSLLLLAVTLFCRFLEAHRWVFRRWGEGLGLGMVSATRAWGKGAVLNGELD